MYRGAKGGIRGTGGGKGTREGEMARGRGGESSNGPLFFAPVQNGMDSFAIDSGHYLQAFLILFWGLYLQPLNLSARTIHLKSIMTLTAMIIVNYNNVHNNNNDNYQCRNYLHWHR